MFDPDAYLADLAVARKLAKARGLEVIGMVRNPRGRFEGMTQPRVRRGARDDSGETEAVGPRGRRGITQGTLL